MKSISRDGAVEAKRLKMLIEPKIVSDCIILHARQRW